MTSKSSHHVPLFYETFRHACEKLTADFYKTEKSGEKDYSTELYINQVNLNVKKIIQNIYHADKEHTDAVVTYTQMQLLLASQLQISQIGAYQKMRELTIVYMTGERGKEEVEYFRS